jgi:hypothetical protein
MILHVFVIFFLTWRRTFVFQNLTRLNHSLLTYKECILLKTSKYKCVKIE